MAGKAHVEFNCTCQWKVNYYLVYTFIYVCLWTSEFNVLVDIEWQPGICRTALTALSLESTEATYTVLLGSAQKVIKASIATTGDVLLPLELRISRFKYFPGGSMITIVSLKSRMRTPQ